MEEKKTQTQFDFAKTKQYIYKYWDQTVMPSLEDFIRIPNLSKSFDTKWNENGLLMKAANHVISWIEK